MALFSIILDALDAGERMALRALTRPYVALQETFFERREADDRSDVSVKRVTDAYCDVGIAADAEDDATASRQELASVGMLMEGVDLSNASSRELAMLRRRLAWLHHPDRAHSNGPRLIMAEVNARIDEAIQKLRK